MNRICIILYFLSVNIIFGQDWKLVKTDTSNEFLYAYEFRFMNLDDVSVTDIIKSKNDTSSFNLTGRVLSTDGEVVPFVKVFVTPNEGGEVIKIVSDVKGEFQTNLPEGEFSIRTSSCRHDRLDFYINIIPNEQVFLDISLGLTQEIITYQINSKEKLTEEKINEIMSCVKANRSEVYDTCSELGNYFVTILS